MEFVTGEESGHGGVDAPDSLQQIVPSKLLGLGLIIQDFVERFDIFIFQRFLDFGWWQGYTDLRGFRRALFRGREEGLLPLRKYRLLLNNSYSPQSLLDCGS